jgi:hypothetical protein
MMPLDSVSQAPPGWDRDQLEESFYRRAIWHESFVWWPRRCNITGRWLWLTTAVEGSAMWTGPGDPVFEFRWHDSKEHVLWLLKSQNP